MTFELWGPFKGQWPSNNIRILDLATLVNGKHGYLVQMMQFCTDIVIIFSTDHLGNGSSDLTSEEGEMSISSTYQNNDVW